MEQALSLWAMEISPGSTTSITPTSGDLRITNASLSDTRKPGLTTVKANFTQSSNGASPATQFSTTLCCFTTGKLEVFVVHFVIPKGQLVHFQVLGDSSVSLLGTYMGRVHDDIQLESPGETAPNVSPASLDLDATAASRGAIENYKGIDVSASSAALASSDAEQVGPSESHGRIKRARVESAVATESQAARGSTQALETTPPSVTSVLVENGLVYEDWRAGDEGPSVENGDTVTLLAQGRLSDTKTVFERCPKNALWVFEVGRADHVVPGIHKAIRGMRVSGSRRIIMTFHHGFGELGNAQKKVPAKAHIYYDCILLKIERPQVSAGN